MNKRETTILPVMIGTAGHVDHGKTSLVKLLTGCDTDRLKEEKERGLTIDLGFAPCKLPGNRIAGIIDVPGHIDFIRNMVAGAASMDILMLIIAADDSIMPQTKEHLQIIEQLRTSQLMVVITKIDLVEEELLKLVIEEVTEFISNTKYENVPICPISNTSLEGISNVKKELDKLVSSVTKNEDKRDFRMNIERTFSLKGHGTVATGIPISGEISIGDKVLLLPNGITSRVRSIQNYRNQVQQSTPNICAAINLPDITLDQIKRGMTLVKFNSRYKTSQFIIAEIQNKNDQYKIEHNKKIRFHFGTGAIIAKISFLSKKNLEPGEREFAKIRLSSPLTLVTGDKFILRQLSPSITLGGGVVLTPTSGVDFSKIIRGTSLNSAGVHDSSYLNNAVKAINNKDYLLAELLSTPKFIYKYDQNQKNQISGNSEIVGDLQLLIQMNDEDTKNEINQKLDNNILTKLEGDIFIVNTHLPLALKDITKHLIFYHKSKPTSWGIDAAQFAKIYNLDKNNFAKFAKVIAKYSNTITFSYQRLSLKSFTPLISRDEMSKIDMILDITTSSGIVAPAIGDLITKIKSNKKEINKLIKVLVEEDEIITIGKNILLKDEFEIIKKNLKIFFDNNEFLEINDFREFTNASRNFTVSLLEKLDTLGITKRIDKGRIYLIKRNKILDFTPKVC